MSISNYNIYDISSLSTGVHSSDFKFEPTKPIPQMYLKYQANYKNQI